MTRNRLSRLFGKSCRCCRARRKLRRLAAECNALEKMVGNVAEFLVPSVDSYLKGERRAPRLFLATDFVEAPYGADLRVYAAGELRRVALEMIGAADRLEGGGA